MNEPLRIKTRDEQNVPITMISTFPKETINLLEMDGVTTSQYLLENDPFEFSLDYGLDIQTTMLAFREASILQKGGVPSMAPFPKNALFINIFYLQGIDPMIWLAGITTSISILHWLSFSKEVNEEIILRKLEFHLLPLSKQRPIVFISQLPKAHEILKKKASFYGLSSLSTLLDTKTMVLSKYVEENLLWNGEKTILELFHWLGIPFNHTRWELDDICKEAHEDLHLYGKLRKQTAMMAVQYSVDLFESINFLKDYIIEV
ncbi:MAG: hypothetical protein D6732_07825 [Methanobacteriota archaeon]|nr:MAG: hypothetical protein D6732_07825 [Euryarchaeota archaeon]